MLSWDIKSVIYTPSKDNTTADALSRRPKTAVAALVTVWATLNGRKAARVPEGV